MTLQQLPTQSISRDDKDYKDQNYWHGRTWSPMIQLVYWGLEQYTGAEAVGARKGLVAQSKALLLKVRGGDRLLAWTAIHCHMDSRPLPRVTSTALLRLTFAPAQGVARLRERLDSRRLLRWLWPLRLRELRRGHWRG